MMNRLVPFIALASVAATCGTPNEPGVPTDIRIDGAGSPPDGIWSRGTQMCLTPNGTVYAVWVDDRSGTTDVWMNRKLGGGERHEGWLPAPIRVNQVPDSEVFNPKVACDDTAVHVVWEDDRDGEIESHQIYYNTSRTQGDTWHYLEDILLERDEEGRSMSLEPVIALAGANVYVAWYDNIFGAFDILFRRSNNQGLEWVEDPVRVDGGATAGEAYSSSVEIATANDGTNVYLTWEDARDGHSDIYFTRSLDQGLSFADPTRLDVSDAPGATNSFSPKIAADGENVYVVWHDARAGDNNDVYMAYSANAGLAWSVDTRPNSTEPAGAFQSLYPAICVVGTTAHVAWHDNRDNGFFRIYYNRAVDGGWVGEHFRLDADKLSGVPNSETASIACQGQDVVVSWLDERHDPELGYNDLYYNFSQTGGEPGTWLGQEEEYPRLDSVVEGSAFKVDVHLALRDGTIHALWGDGRNGSEDVYYQQVPIGETAPVVPESQAPPQPGG